MLWYPRVGEMIRFYPDLHLRTILGPTEKGYTVKVVSTRSAWSTIHNRQFHLTVVFVGEEYNNMSAGMPARLSEITKIKLWV